MEVHHTHSARKKWTHYFWEFLMLFLAVFCGFLAEWKLEHTIEHQREKQFMRSMVEDLEKDISLLENEARLVMTQYAGLDTLTTIIYAADFEGPQVRKMYEIQRRFMRPVNLTLISRTELQLKNAGGMRLIRKTNVADSIINYWSVTELLTTTKTNVNYYLHKAKDLAFTIFNNKYSKGNWDFGVFSGEPELMTKDMAILTQFANQVSFMADLLLFNYKQARVERQAGNARRLVQLIKREYRL